MDKFLIFLKSITSEKHEDLIESISEGYMACFESIFAIRPKGMLKLLDLGNSYRAIFDIKNKDGHNFTIEYPKNSDHAHMGLGSMDHAEGSSLNWDDLDRKSKIEIGEKYVKGKLAEYFEDREEKETVTTPEMARERTNI